MPTIPQPVATFSKDPQDLLDYSVDWTSLLEDDTISTVVWTVDAGLTNSGTLFSRALTIIFLSGGTAGVGYNVTCHITTPTRSYTRSFKVNVVNS